ncbi:protein LYK2 isoform X2 [Cicer arietinum]|uniref:protein LYK2 isoform X2 n=1 Tax=Cicer arietinum TaxID=3827 RepID=UPI003CC6C79A
MDKVEKMIITFHMKVLVFFLWLFASSLGKNLLTCETSPHASSFYHCNENVSQNHCETFALFFTNSHYSSLSNLTLYLGLNKFVIAKTNGFSEETELFPLNHPLLIPIDCKCTSGFFQGELIKTTIKGESFYEISQSLEGLTSCKAIKDNNFGVLSPWNLDGNLKLVIPLKCACPFASSPFVTPKPKYFLSYPIIEGDTISNLALKFNITKEAIVSSNNLSSSKVLEPFTTILIPLNNNNPFLDFQAKPKQPNSYFPTNNITITKSQHKKSKMRTSEFYIGLIGVAIGAFFALVVTFLYMRLLKQKKVEENSCKERNMELQHLNQSVRTTSDKKASFEGSQDTLDGKINDSKPHKVLLETYTIEDLRKVTEDFSSNFHIEGSVFHGCLNGKNIAIKKMKNEILSKFDLEFFHDAIQDHPNIIKLLGTCISKGSSSDSFLVFEYAKNGSLKDWLHGGLAIKNQFISSCYCFLNWNQRLKICLDVASALDYMHHVMNPSYVHFNVKSRNIFLDEEFGAKIGKFGMSNCVENETKDPKFYSTNRSSWSLGYLAPEFVHQVSFVFLSKCGVHRGDILVMSVPYFK